VIEFAEHRDVALESHPHEAFDAQIRPKRAVVEWVNLVAGGGVEYEAEMSGFDLVQDGYDLAFGQLPRLPPERGVAPATLHGVVEEVQELR
jgi:hypothetical protein